MSENGLVICKNVEPFKDLMTCSFSLGGLYRRITITEDNTTQHMVYGVTMDDKTFNECFIEFAPVIQKKAREIFYPNGEKLTKTAFKKDYADVHQYGKRTTGTKVVYFGHPKINCFAIRGNYDYTKAQLLDFAYTLMESICNGGIEWFDNGFVRWLNTGIPLSMTYNFWSWQNVKGLLEK
jgi:hypothetical protein